MPIDGMLQPRIGSLHAGVSRQAPLLRSPSQMEEIENYLPSVDIGGLVDRLGTRRIAALNRMSYTESGHTCFRTTDGSRWVFLKRAEAGLCEVRNLITGELASLTYGPFVQNYLGTSTSLRFLTISDTVLILNTAVKVAVTEAAKPPLSRAYVAIKRLSTAYQSFYVNSIAGSASVVYDGQGGATTRDWVASQLAAQIAANLPGVYVTRINNVIKMEGPANVIASLTGSNDWDEAAMTLIKGRVRALADLPNVFFHGEPILVDLGNDNTKSQYYVTYDSATNSYKESSYLDAFATSATLDRSTLPIRLHQTGPNSFELQPNEWNPRKVGDADSNEVPQFVGRAVSDMALWKGRLWLASGDWVVGSQPDTLFNFWKDSAREVVASDPVPLQVDADQGQINHLAAFRDSLMVLTENAQCEVDGSGPVTPAEASMGTATRYNLDEACPPKVIGDALYYTGNQEGRSVLWEYKYEQQTSNNAADDLSKHVPDYCPGRIRRIVGSPQAGRVFMWSEAVPDKLFVQTSYWQDRQRKQNAWSKLSFPGISRILYHWVDRGTLYYLGVNETNLYLLSVAVDGNLGETPSTDQRLDMQSQVQVTWNVARNRSEVIVPAGMNAIPNLICLVDNGVGWFYEFPVTVVWDGSQWVGHFPMKVEPVVGYLGIRFTRSFTFSPFYPAVEQGQTPMGHLHVHKVYLDCLRAADFRATVKRRDRAPMTVALAPRTTGEALVADDGANTQYGIPFNAQGHKASLTVSTDSTGPMVVTGYTLAARYANLFGS